MTGKNQRKQKNSCTDTESIKIGGYADSKKDLEKKEVNKNE